MICVLFYASSHAQRAIVDDPINDFVEPYRDTTDVVDRDRRILVRIFADFNNDGIRDIALSDTYHWGNAGSDWEIYLGRQDGKYEFLTEAFFHPLAFRLEQIKKGNSKLIVYMRDNAVQGYLKEYEISSQGFKEISSRLLKTGDESSRDHAEYWQLFGHLYKKPVSECCKLYDYLQNPKVKWQLGYYLSEK